MHSSVGDEQHIARFDAHGLPVHLIFERSFENVDDLLPRVRVAREKCAGCKVDPRLENLATRNTEVMALEIGTR
jgi:hypothetical protein